MAPYFFEDLYTIIKKYYKNIQKFRSNLKGKLKGKKVIQEEKLLHIHNSKRILKNINLESKERQSNSTTIDLKILSSHLDLMTQKISHFSGIKKSKVKGNIEKSKQKVEKTRMKNLKREIEGISDIKKKDENKNINIRKQDRKKQRIKNHCSKPQLESYGLQKAKYKKPNKKMSLKSLARQNIYCPLSLPQSPEPHLLSLKTHLKQPRTTKDISYQHRGCSMTLASFPSSPSIHKSVSIGMSKSGSSRSILKGRKR